MKKQRVEQEKAQRAKADLADAREKAAEKQQAAEEAKVASQPGAKRASHPAKRKKIHREKIRFGEAPRKALPTGTAQTAEAGNNATPLGQTAGAALGSSTDTVTTITTGTGVEESNVDGMAPKPVVDHKTRFTDREKESEEKRAQDKLAKAEVKATMKPVAATSEESADEKTQANPLGLNGNTGPKKKKHQKSKRDKDQPKERLQDKPKPAETAPPPPAPTVNPALGTTPAPPPPAPSSQPAPPSSNPQ
jgi:peptidyl-prolyl cis-trans isomerase SurA